MNHKLVILLLCLTSVLAVKYKKLSGPPEDFSKHSIPDPTSTVTVDRSAAEFVWFNVSKFDLGGDLYTTIIPIDSAKDFTFTFASPHHDKLELSLYDPNGNKVDLSDKETKTKFPIAVGVELPISVFKIMNSIPGDYKLDIKVKNNMLTRMDIIALSESHSPNAAVAMMNDDQMEIHTHMTTYIVKSGQNIGFVSKIVSSAIGAVYDIDVTSGDMGVLTPEGSDLNIPMQDDGSFDDGLPGDGTYGAILQANQPGRYIIQAKLNGFVVNPATGADPIPFTRTTQHFLHVSNASIEINGKAALQTLDNDRFAVHIGVDSFGNQPPLRAYAEVWATKTSALVPACWIGGAVEVQNGHITLELNKNWIGKADASGPFVLRNVYIADMHTTFPVTKFGEDIKVSGSDELAQIQFPKPEFVTKEMLQGVNPLPPLNKTNAATKPNLLLLPGYCADWNPWQRNMQDFNNGIYFWEKGSFPIDQYAKKVMAFLEANDLESFGIIAHSQGGMVSTHIHNYYWTGLESATGGRLIQSVGTPYAGTTIAGTASSFGYLFGVGCGSNNDLTRDGAANWVAGISMDTRKDVYFYTTTYELGSTIGDWCSLPTNLILQWPNDGITELNYAKLEGGNYLGNKEKWCHSTEMGYPSQYDDQERNVEMSNNASR